MNISLAKNKSPSKKQTTKTINSNTEDEDLKVVVGRVSDVPQTMRESRLSTTITRTILTELNNASNKYDAIDLLVDKTPFGRMALNVYTTLTNPTGQYIFVNPKTGKRTKRPDSEWESFSRSRINNSDNGLDSVYEALVRSLYTRGEMMLEIIVNEDMKSIKTIAIIDAKTISKATYLDSEERYAFYQQRSDSKEVDLYSGNFIRIPYQTSLTSPFGTSPFEPAIQASTNYYQHNLDATTILNRIGYPRYKTIIDEKAVLETARPNEKETFEKRNELFEQVFNQAESNLRSISRDSDIITFSSTDVNVIGGGANGSGIDIRAWFEMDMVEMCNSYGIPKIYLNGDNGGSYALGNAEQEGFIKRIDNSRQSLIGIKETVGTFFCRLLGYNAECKFIADPLDWQNQDEKWKSKLKMLEYYRRQFEYGLMDNDTVANEINGSDKAVNDGLTGFAYIKTTGSSVQKDAEIEQIETKEE